MSDPLDVDTSAIERTMVPSWIYASLAALGALTAVVSLMLAQQLPAWFSVAGVTLSGIMTCVTSGALAYNLISRRNESGTAVAFEQRLSPFSTKIEDTVPSSSTWDQRSFLKIIVMSATSGVCIVGVALLLFAELCGWTGTGPTCTTLRTSPPWSLLTALAAAPSLLVTWYWRNTHRHEDINAKHNEHARELARINFERESARNHLLAEMYFKAVELIGSENNETKIGGIYALQRVARDGSEHEARTVVEALSAFVRDNTEPQPDGNSDLRELSTVVRAALTVMGNVCEGRDIRFMDLRGWTAANLHLQRVNLKYANLKGANLKGANLKGANLEKAEISRANLREADLRGANLKLASLKGASLEKTNLEKTNLEKTNLEKARLEGANLSEAGLYEANLRGADLCEATLRGADLRRANLSDADLSDANLSDANLRGANLRGANLRGANLGGAVFEKTDLEGAYIEAAYFDVF